MKDVGSLIVIEDNEETVGAISIAFQIRWPEVEIISAGEGAKGIELVETRTPDLVILDIGLPDMSGFEVLKRIRLFSAVPVIILTVRGEETDVIRGLEGGADEYIVKPFRQLELLSRAATLLRRSGCAEVEPTISCGPLTLDFQTRTFCYKGKETSLTRSESLILGRLIKDAGKVVSHSALAEELWGNECPELRKGMKVHVRRLRQKIEPDPSHPSLIITRAGVGYLLARPT